jgi:hypothetical protein
MTNKNSSGFEDEDEIIFTNMRDADTLLFKELLERCESITAQGLDSVPGYIGRVKVNQYLINQCLISYERTLTELLHSMWELAQTSQKYAPDVVPNAERARLELAITYDIGLQVLTQAQDPAISRFRERLVEEHKNWLQLQRDIAVAPDSFAGC